METSATFGECYPISFFDPLLKIAKQAYPVHKIMSITMSNVSNKFNRLDSHNFQVT